ncbi:radical SAM protein [Patescibacteria group bacterium]|nr:radical SAM protein [Patescibacteria group bacterium]
MLEFLGKKLPSVESLKRVLENLMLPERDKKPLVVAWYPDYRCNFRCPHCSQSEYTQGENNQYLGRELLDSFKDLEMIREGCSNIYFLGGEPTILKDLMSFLKKCDDLKFDVIGLNTNGFRYRPEILKYVNLLVFSLNSLDPDKMQDMAGFPSGGENIHRIVLSNLKKYALESQNTGTEIVVNTVVTGENLDDVPAIMDLCRELGIKINIAPVIMPNGFPDGKLFGFPGGHKYFELIESLENEPELVSVSLAYLKKIKSFGYFKCVPNTVPGVDPEGKVIVPCPNLGSHKRISMEDNGGLLGAIAEGRNRMEGFDPEKDCVGICHKTCYVEAASISSVFDLINKTRIALALGVEDFDELPFGFRDLEVGGYEAVRDANLFVMEAYPFVDLSHIEKIDKLSTGAIDLLRSYFLIRVMKLQSELNLEPSLLELFAATVVDRLPNRIVEMLEFVEVAVNRPFLPDPTKRRKGDRLYQYAHMLKRELANRSKV